MAILQQDIRYNWTRWGKKSFNLMAKFVNMLGLVSFESLPSFILQLPPSLRCAHYTWFTEWLSTGFCSLAWRQLHLHLKHEFHIVHLHYTTNPLCLFPLVLFVCHTQNPTLVPSSRTHHSVAHIHVCVCFILLADCTRRPSKKVYN